MRTSDRFRPSLFFKNAHVQTILGSSKLRTLGLNAMRAAARERIIQTAEGVRLLGYHSMQNHMQAKGLVILLHGWEGSVDSTYILCCGRKLFGCGYDIFRLNFRDHGDSHHLNKGIFYAVLLEEIYQAVQHAAGLCPDGPVFLIGFSLGGNFVLRILERCVKAPIENLRHAVCISPVLNPETSTAQIDQIAFIRRYFLAKWRRSLKKKQGLFPDLYDFEEILQLQTIRAVTDALLEKYSKFQSARDYFQAYSVVDAAVKDLATPTTIITAEDDPIIPIADFYKLKLNEHIHLVVHSHGGHNGFINGFNLKSWYENKIVEIFNLVAQNQNG